MKKVPLSFTVLFALSLSSASAVVTIDNFATDFATSGAKSSISQSFFDSETGESATFTISASSFPELSVATHLGVNGNVNTEFLTSNSITLTWDKEVTLESTKLFGGAGKDLIIDSSAFDQIDGVGNNISIGQIVPAYTAVTFTAGSNAGYRIDNVLFTVTAIPEVSSYALIGGGFMLFWGLLRYRLAKK